MREQRRGHKSTRDLLWQQTHTRGEPEQADLQVGFTCTVFISSVQDPRSPAKDGNWARSSESTEL